MNRMLKFGLTAIALAAVAPAYAEDIEEEEPEGPIGWTPVAIGLATPVQLPWGLNRWDVFGLDVNLFYTDAPKLYGIGVGGLAELTRDRAIGLLVGGLANVAFDDVYGMRATLGLNYCSKSVYGAEVGLVGFRDTLHGLDVQLLGAYQSAVCGMQVGARPVWSPAERNGVGRLTRRARPAFRCDEARLSRSSSPRQYLNWRFCH